MGGKVNKLINGDKETTTTTAAAATTRTDVGLMYQEYLVETFH